MKPEHKELLRERARDALRNLYHNATPALVRDLRGRSDGYFQAWFEDTARFEIEYIQGGGAYGTNYRKTLEHECNAGRYKSEKARGYYIRKGMREMREEREDCGMLTGWRALEFAVMACGGKVGGVARARLTSLRKKYPDLQRNNSRWERISEFGELFQYGRGGRTLAPRDLMTGRGSIREDYADGMNAESLTDFIRVLESFNAYVERWNASIPEQWREHCVTEDAMIAAEKRRAAARKAKETRERNYWACRGLVTA